MIYIVCDLGFGDSGKGTIVDYLLSECANRYNRTLVVRYNGGYQAAHHVVTDGVRRRYSQIGAGSLNYPNVDTYIGPQFIFSPEHLNKELVRNNNHRDSGYVYIDPQALLATNYARHVNNSVSGDSATCGKGIGVTRKYWLDYGSDAPVASDLAGCRHFLWSKLELMRQRLCPLFYTLQDYMLSKNIRIWQPEWHRYENIIFEGSQGVLLDENYGVGAPDHATWSTTTMLHAEQIIDHYSLRRLHEVRSIGILRAYATRHGSGPFEEDSELTERLAPLEVDNLNDGPQGRFKFGRLRPELIEYALNIPYGDVDEIAVTCLDQLTPEESAASLKLIQSFKPVNIQSWGPGAAQKWTSTQPA